MTETTTTSILAVDDSIDNLNLLQAIFETSVHKIRLAPNGELALRAVAASKPDLLLLDVNMPGMSGIEICQKIRTEYSSTELPIVFLSGDTSDEQRQRILDVGGNDIVTKPYRVQKLLDVVASYLGNS